MNQEANPWSAQGGPAAAAGAGTGAGGERVGGHIWVGLWGFLMIK